jgi:REP element-mobilizing transposase RayT
MKYNPQIHRRSIRLKTCMGEKFFAHTSSGAYFVTIVTHGRQCLFGQIVDGQMRLNEWGEIAKRCWMEIPQHYPYVILDAFVIMPNHVHGIIILNDNGPIVWADIVWANNHSPQRNDRPRGTTQTIGSIVRGFKIGVTKWFRQYTDIYNVWQRNYYEHIIRNDMEWQRIRQYIVNNPIHWRNDEII